MQTALLDGLFVSQKKTEAPILCAPPVAAAYDWHHERQTYPQAIHLQIHAPYRLSVETETVLLAILFLLEWRGHPLASEARADPDGLLAPEGEARHKATGEVETTRHALLMAAGWGDSARAYRQLDQQLYALSQVTLHYRNTVTGWDGLDRLLQYRLKPSAKSLRIQVNWRLAGSVFGPYLYALVDLQERQHLHSAGAKTMHRWLSAHVWPGKTRQVLLSTLIGHVWPDTANTAGADRVRRHRMRTDILPALNQLAGWSLELDAKGLVTITRAHSVSIVPAAESITDVRRGEESPNPAATPAPRRWDRLDGISAHQAWLALQWSQVRSRIVIVSPFLSARAIRADGIVEGIRRACRRGVSVTIYYDMSWVADHPASAGAVRMLSEAGAHVQGLSGIHAKIVLVDETIAEGSFNWLSAERTRSDYQRWDTTVIYRDPALVGPWGQRILNQLEALIP